MSCKYCKYCTCKAGWAANVKDDWRRHVWRASSVEHTMQTASTSFWSCSYIPASLSTIYAYRSKLQQNAHVSRSSILFKCPIVTYLLFDLFVCRWMEDWWLREWRCQIIPMKQQRLDASTHKSGIGTIWSIERIIAWCYYHYYYVFITSDKHQS